MEHLLGTNGIHVGFPTLDCGLSQSQQAEIPAIGLGAVKRWTNNLDLFSPNFN